MRFLNAARSKVENWYRGEDDPVTTNHDDSLVVLGPRFRRHWTAKLARTLIEFYLLHWKWCIGTAIALVYVYLKLN